MTATVVFRERAPAISRCHKAIAALTDEHV